MKQLSKKLLYKSSNTKRQGIKIKRWLSKKSVTVSAKDFEGEIPLNLRLKQNQSKTKA
nr:hypothetical protein [Mycoplasmopsis bovis]